MSVGVAIGVSAGVESVSTPSIGVKVKFSSKIIRFGISVRTLIPVNYHRLKPSGF